MNHYFVSQTTGKRFLAGFLDFVFVVILALFLFVPAQVIADNSGAAAVNMEIGLTALYSGLFKLDAEDNRIHEVSEDADLPEALYTFYVDKRHPDRDELQRGFSPILVDGKDFNEPEDYYVVILGKGDAVTLFDFTIIDVNKPWDVPALPGQETAVKTFYQTEIETAFTLLDNHPKVRELVRRSEFYSFMTIASSYLLSALILIVFIPLFLKDKATLGKLVTKTVVVNHYGYKMTNLQAIVRNFSVFLFSFTFFFMPFHIISFFLSMFSKTKRSLYDRLSDTLVADKKTTLVFDNVQDETIYRKELAQRLIEVERRKSEARREELDAKR